MINKKDGMALNSGTYLEVFKDITRMGKPINSFAVSKDTFSKFVQEKCSKYLPSEHQQKMLIDYIIIADKGPRTDINMVNFVRAMQEI